jgi:hypothetical protein
MFADDTSISYSADSLEELQNVINSELKNLNDWLIANKLSLNMTKTEFMIIGSRQRINATQDNIDIGIDDHELNRVYSVKSLWLHIDSHLTWSVHIEKICKKIYSAIGALKRIRSFITTKTAVQVYFALIQPHFDYCCSVWAKLSVPKSRNYKTERLESSLGRVMAPVLLYF